MATTPTSNEENERIVRDMLDREIVKEALNEWLTAQFAKFGRWTFYGLLSAAIVGLTYFAIYGMMPWRHN